MRQRCNLAHLKPRVLDGSRVRFRRLPHASPALGDGQVPGDLGDVAAELHHLLDELAQHAG